MEKLTNREIQVLLAIAQGHTTKEIAHALFVSHHTILTHRKKLLLKLQALNAASLVYNATKLGILP